jgi:RHS repeat-associated protein
VYSSVSAPHGSTPFKIVILLSLLAIARSALATNYYESNVISAGRPDGLPPTVLETDPVEACRVAISRIPTDPSAQPLVNYYTQPSSGGLTYRYYYCNLQFVNSSGNLVTGGVGYMYPVCRINGSYIVTGAVCTELPEKNCPNCPAPMAGNPIHLGLLAKAQRENDFAPDALSGLSFERLYFSDAFMGKGRVGKLWRDNYDRSVNIGAITPDGYFLLRRDTERNYRFRWYQNTLSADPDTVGTLTRLTDGSGQLTGWQFVTPRDETELYDAAGRLLSITNIKGVSQALNYDAVTGRLSSVVDSFGRSLTFAYHSNGLVESVTHSSGTSVHYTYDARLNLTSALYPDSTTRIYIYNEALNTSGENLPNALTGIVDESGNRFATFKYNAQGAAVSSEHSGGAEAVSVQIGNNNSRVVTDSLGTQRTYATPTVQGVYKNGGLTKLCATCGGNYKSATFDANGNFSSKIDFNDNKTCYNFDLTRNLETARLEGLASATTCPASIAAYTPVAGTRQRKTTTQWDSMFRLPVLISELNRTTAFSYDASGNLLTRTVTDTTTSTSRTWTYTYTSLGQVLSADGPRSDVSDVTAYTYYSCSTGSACGQIHTMTNAVGHVTTYNTYNGYGQPLTITDPNGVVTTLTYDTRQRLLSRAVGTELTSFTYWPTGLIRKAIMPDGSYLEYTYDGAHRLTGINDQEGNRIVYTLDLMGNRTAEQSFDPSSVLTQARTRVFNVLSQLQKEIGAAGTVAVTTEYTYDTNGNRTRVDAPLNRDTVQTYDELNRLKTVTDPGTGLTQYGYNALDQLISVTDPRTLATSYTYNALGDLEQQVSPDTGTTANTYDSGGNLKTSMDARGAVTTYTYDELNRVLSAAFKIGATTDQTIIYGYDAGTNGKGHITSAVDADHSLSWSYDAQGRLTGKTQIQGSVSQSVAYAYTDGLLTSMTTPSGQSIVYSYSNGKVSGITINGTTLLNDVLYDPFGPIRQWTWGNSTLSVRSYDADGKITQLDSAGLNTYSYDDAFRITGLTDTNNSLLSWTYGYDALDRLTNATTSAQMLGWTYDADGNRLTQTGSGASTFTVAPASNRLSGTSGSLSRTYSYDAAGNTTSDGTNTFAYNYRGRMKSATNGSTTTYTYNALGQRIKKAGSATTLFVYDEAGHLLGEYSSTGALLQETVWLGDTPVATIRPKTGGVDVFYVHADHLNTPRKISRPSDNKLRWRWDSTPFGTGVPDENPDGVGVFGYNLRFPGQHYDVETGLNYNYFRDYDSATGRYVQSDPIGLLGGTNTYAYVAGNPLSHFDPDGQMKLPGDPSGLPPGWTPDPSHKDPNGERWRSPGGEDYVDWHPGRPGLPGWRGKDHWHHNGGKEHLPPGDEVPDPPGTPMACGENCTDKVATVVVGAAGAYLVWRCARMIPSLAPPLWWTIPANVALP